MAFIHLLMVISATLVSTSFTVGAAITAELDPVYSHPCPFYPCLLYFRPLDLLQVRLGIFLVAFLPLCSYQRLSGYFFLLYVPGSLRYTSALNTSVIFALVPSISAIYSMFFLGERLRKEQLLALVFGMVGVVWVIFRGDLSLLLAMDWNKGDLIFLGGCFAMGLYTPLINFCTVAESMAIMTFWVLVTGSLWLLPFAGSKLTIVAWSAVPVCLGGSCLFGCLYNNYNLFSHAVWRHLSGAHPG